eukprot:NODE_453_length_7238_cov_1.750245.p4 type:complete len:286 gc:universal NODE_453_length_7238_cov_1.750245:1828-971(-)
MATLEIFLANFGQLKNRPNLDITDPFISKIIFKEISMNNSRISKRSFLAFSPYSESLFKILNIYDNEDITESELGNAITYTIKKYQNEIVEKSSVFSCCQKLQTSFFRFGLFIGFTIIFSGLIPSPFSSLVLFVGLLMSPLFIYGLLRNTSAATYLSKKNWNIGSPVTFNQKDYTVCNYNLEQVIMESDNMRICQKLPLQEISMTKFITCEYKIKGSFNPDQLYLIYKGLLKKTHRFVKEVKVFNHTENEVHVVFIFKRETRSCLPAILEVLKKLDVEYNNIYTP